MNINVAKIALYVVLMVLIVICGKRFLDRYSALMSTEVNSDPYESAEILKPTLAPEIIVVDTNEPGTTVDETGEAAESVEENRSDQSVDDARVLAAETVPAPEVSPPTSEPMTKGSFDRGKSPDASGIGLYVVALFGLILALGVLTAHDVSTFLGQRTHKLLHNEEGEGIYSAAYDAAEEMWANGEYLEAIRMMREYLNKNPREVHVMIRIAEIYEKDLGNFLAAALEYEELLKKKLPKERWGWAAIHLVNLYFGKIDKPKEGLALLYRIHREYGHTAAAEKARKRLLQLDPGFQAELDHWEAEQAGREVVEQDQEDEAFVEETASLPSHQPPAEEDPNLPKGFRKKK